MGKMKTGSTGFGEDVIEKAVFAMEAKKNSSFMPLATGTFAMMQGNYKLIWYLGYAGYDDVYELYNVKMDPEELIDLSESRSEVKHQLADQLRQKLLLLDTGSANDVIRE